MPPFDFRVLVACGILLLLSACASEEIGEITLDHQPAESIPDGPLKPRSLLGVAPHALLARLGEPNFKRSEPVGAEVWQYSGGACNLFVYFYRNNSGLLDSTFVDARQVKGGSASAGDCLNEVQQLRSGAPVS